MGGDWIRLHRKALESRAWNQADPWLWKLWCWCLLRASWTENWKHGRRLSPGMFVTRRAEAAEQLNCHPSRVYRGLRILAEWGQISLEANNQFTVVTVCNWTLYQSEGVGPRTTGEQRVNNGRTTVEQPSLLVEELEESEECARGARRPRPPEKDPRVARGVRGVLGRLPAEGGQGEGRHGMDEAGPDAGAAGRHPGWPGAAQAQRGVGTRPRHLHSLSVPVPVAPALGGRDGRAGRADPGRDGRGADSARAAAARGGGA